MNKQILKNNKLERRKHRVRAKIKGSVGIPRLRVSKTNRYIYAQLINDEAGETIVGKLSKSINKNGTKLELSLELGREVAKKAREKEVKKVVFDRGGNKYHGRVAAVAQGAREEGLDF